LNYKKLKKLNFLYWLKMTRHVVLSLVVFLTFLCYALAQVNIMSLYYYSQTTFINLNKTSEDVQIEFLHHETLNETHLEKSSKLLGEFFEADKITKVQGGYQIQTNVVGDISVLSSKTITKFFKAPNGQRSRQGWINSIKQYPTDEYLAGDLKSLKKLQMTAKQFNFFNVNVKVPRNATFLRDLLINRFREKNELHLRLEKNLKIGKRSLSDGFRNLLCKKDADGKFTYNPDMKTLYQDFIIRQALELYNSPSDVWNADISLLRKEFLALEYNHPYYRIDITPVLLNSVHDEEITEKLKNCMVIDDVVRFREFENDIVQSVERAVGLVKATQLLGHFIADNAISEVSFIEVHLIQQIRKLLSEGKKIFVKYITWEYEKCPKIYSQEAKYLIELFAKEKFVFGYIPTGE
jgi:hypothetical protein